MEHAMFKVWRQPIRRFLIRYGCPAVELHKRIPWTLYRFTIKMLRQTIRLARPARLFSTSVIARNASQAPKEFKTAKSLSEVVDKYDLVGPGAQPGTVPTDLEQATGLERLELLGKLEGVEVFENEPLDSSRKGTMADPIVVNSYDDYRYVGCTGSPAGSHEIMWLKPTVEKVARCWECGSVYKLKYLGTGEGHHH